MWMEFIHNYKRDRANEGTIKELMFVETSEIVSFRESSTEVWVEAEEDHKDFPCLEIVTRGGKQMDVLEISYTEMKSLLSAAPKNSPYYRRSV